MQCILCILGWLLDVVLLVVVVVVVVVVVPSVHKTPTVGLEPTTIRLRA